MNTKYELIKAIKYIIVAASSFIIDLFLFTIIDKMLGSILQDKSIIIATIIARILSSLYNYFMNSRVVFKKYNKASIIKYYILFIVQMMVSAVSVYLISKIFITISSTIIKLGVDVVIFVINYAIQRRFIFK